MSPSLEIIYSSESVNPRADVVASNTLEPISAKYVAFAPPFEAASSSNVTALLENLPQVDSDYQAAFVQLLAFEPQPQQPDERDLKPRLRYRTPH